MSRHHEKKATAIDRLSALEVLWETLHRDYEAATYHQNPLVADCINLSSNYLYQATQHLFSERVEQALGLADAAWLRIHFGRQIFEADNVEHLLGESDYLELCESTNEHESLVVKYFDDLELRTLQLLGKLEK